MLLREFSPFPRCHVACREAHRQCLNDPTEVTRTIRSILHFRHLIVAHGLLSKERLDQRKVRNHHPKSDSANNDVLSSRHIPWESNSDLR